MDAKCAAVLENDSLADSTCSVPAELDSQVAMALEEYYDLLQTGLRPGRSEFLARHVAIAKPLRECLGGLEFVQGAAWQFSPRLKLDEVGESPAHPTMLGEFRIIREIGRGGMGVVYEAKQLSLGRHVALKVLPATASQDPRQRQRFQIEAQAAALLHHDHIVPVFGIGFDQGAHYFAMQLIDGQPLTKVIQELIAQSSPESHTGSSAQTCEFTPEAGLVKAAAPRSPGNSSLDRERCRTTARLGLQAAQALEHAHQIGVIHRDIKPSNLLIDGRGKLWVADFGLARIPQEEFDLTRTGDLVGTLRYMSPEQVRAERGGVDKATDIYSLGVTLYELLTLRPAYTASSRQELVQRILHDDPVRPRRINPSIPRDLETIIFKCIEKEPSARYSSADEFADDLRRFLEDQPIRARRPSLMNRAVKWSRRHRPAVVAGITALILTLATSTAVLWESKRRTEERNEELKKALTGQRLGIEFALGVLDQITRPLVLEGAGDRNQKPEAQRVLPMALSYYVRIPKLVADSGLTDELVAKTYRQAGFCRMALGSPKGRQDYRLAISSYESLAARKPEFIWLRTGLIETLHEYSRMLTAPDDQAEAEALFRRALAVSESLIGNPEAAKHCYTMGLVGPLNDLAWALVKRAPVQLSDAQLAVRLSRQTVEWEPAQAGFWNTLGVAYYRLGDWSSSASSLQKSMVLNGGGDAADWFFLAAIEQHLGKPQQAHQRFDQAVSWMENNPDRVKGREAELHQFQAETALLLSR
jgi:serine/threonine protein kinase/tetratricopeptide (TPR) repeat protein